MRLLDAKDFLTMTRQLTDDAQAIDELSRRWLRGRSQIADYFKQMGAAVKDLHSELKDVRETTADATGLVTCWLEQDYTYEGKPQHISAPTTVVLRRNGSEWRLALIHSAPLPESG
jgi:ketosteroid isomerase-like protein